jgi:unsaturated chondroitin disaccharide hydrolase
MKKIAFILFLTICVNNIFGQNAPKCNMKKLIAYDMAVGVKQYKHLMQILPADKMPKTFEKNALVTSGTDWWCSGFYPGTLLYLFENTGDSTIKNEAIKRLGILEKEKFRTVDHDLGFMMYCSFGNAYRLIPNPAYKAVILQSAESLSTRYRPIIKSIQSWNKSDRFQCPVIIDNMMNLELLAWASQHGGDSKFEKMAINHANSTIKNHFRPDGSSYHVLDYDLSTGKLLKRVTSQGASDSSAWARGQAWGLYGFTMFYRFEKDKAYLNQAKKIANFMLNNPNLPKDKIMFWDYDAPGIPNALRDASAAAITASALLELGQYTKGSEKRKYIKAAKQILKTLSTPEYLAQNGTNGGFILKHGVGALPYKSEVDVPLTYGDYYFIEALTRYKNWYL